MRRRVGSHIAHYREPACGEPRRRRRNRRELICQYASTRHRRDLDPPVAANSRKFLERSQRSAPRLARSPRESSRLADVGPPIADARRRQRADSSRRTLAATSRYSGRPPPGCGAAPIANSQPVRRRRHFVLAESIPIGYRSNPMARYIFITGGVVSSLGKGLASAALGALLQARGYSVRLAQARPLSQRRSGHDEPDPARRGVRHRRRRRDRPRPRPLRALHRPSAPIARTTSPPAASIRS